MISQCSTAKVTVELHWAIVKNFNVSIGHAQMFKIGYTRFYNRICTGISARSSCRVILHVQFREYSVVTTQYGTYEVYSFIDLQIVAGNIRLFGCIWEAYSDLEIMYDSIPPMQQPTTYRCLHKTYLCL